MLDWRFTCSFDLSSNDSVVSSPFIRQKGQSLQLDSLRACFGPEYIEILRQNLDVHHPCVIVFTVYIVGLIISGVNYNAM